VSDAIVIPIALALAVGIGLIVIFSTMFPIVKINDRPGDEIHRVSIVTIPLDASLPGHNFEPATSNVVIGTNNTVRWVSQDTIPSSVIADDDSDPEFAKATANFPDNMTCLCDLKVVPTHLFMINGTTFDFTFTKPGIFGYHSVPHPQMKGKVIVLPQYCATSDAKCNGSIKPKVELTIGGLRDSYKVGEIIDISATQRGGKCTMPEILILDNNGKIVVVSKNHGAISCPVRDSDNEHREFSLSWNPRSNGSPIIMNQTGKYTVLAEYEYVGIEREFMVVK